MQRLAHIRVEGAAFELLAFALGRHFRVVLKHLFLPLAHAVVERLVLETECINNQLAVEPLDRQVQCSLRAVARRIAAAAALSLA